MHGQCTMAHGHVESRRATRRGARGGAEAWASAFYAHVANMPCASHSQCAAVLQPHVHTQSSLRSRRGVSQLCRVSRVTAQCRSGRMGIDDPLTSSNERDESRRISLFSPTCPGVRTRGEATHGHAPCGVQPSQTLTHRRYTELRVSSLELDEIKLVHTQRRRKKQTRTQSAMPAAVGQPGARTHAAPTPDSPVPQTHLI